MNKLWIAWLRKNGHRQGRAVLSQSGEILGTTHCCLGGACVVFKVPYKRGEEFSTGAREYQFGVSKQTRADQLPDSWARQKLGLIGGDGTIKWFAMNTGISNLTSLVYANDEYGFTFKQIADMIQYSLDNAGRRA